jgi:hypothetical protein
LPTGSGNILVVAFSPNYANDQTCFAGTRDSGLFKSGDINAPNWTVAGSLPNCSNSRITSLVISPNYQNDHTVFAGLFAAGVYKSTDRKTV